MEVAVIIAWIGMFIASITNTPGTTVVLAENGKEHNAIVITTQVGEVVVDKVGGYVNLASKNTAPSEVKIMSQSEIETKFQSAIVSEPLAPYKILLYFKAGINELTNESLEKIPEIIENIQKRVPCEVNIIGHTDTKGSNEYNEKLSLERANSVKKLIEAKSLQVEKYNVETYGETDLLIQTEDGVDEPRNRRVELLVR